MYIATDAFTSVAQLYGTELTTSVLHNPGAILKFTYDGEDGSALAVSGTPQASRASTDTGGPKEWENPANLGVTPGTPAADGEVPETTDAGKSTVTAGAADLHALMAAGQPKFVVTCSGCHGVNGQGGAGAVLANNPSLADEGHVASTVIHGLGYMPPFGDGLSDEDIAEIGSYIRNSWGSDFGLLTVEQAAAKR